jgi:aspartate/glutamate racemase
MCVEGLEVMVPDDKDRQAVHEVIYKELVAGRCSRFHVLSNGILSLAW